MGQSTPTPLPATIPFWRDERVLRWLFQIVVLLLILGLITAAALNLRYNLQRVHLDPFNFSFLRRPAGFNIGEGPVFDPQGTFLEAYGVAVFNSLRAIAVGVVLATVLGMVIGISRLSHNWLVRALSLVYIEVMQNTPLLVQLFFWFVLIRSLPAQNPAEIIAIPAIDNAINLPVLVFFSQRAAAIPGIILGSSLRFWIGLLAGLIAGTLAGLWWRRRRESRGQLPVGQFWLGVAGFIVTLSVIWAVAGGLPFTLSLPTLVGSSTGTIFRFVGGTTLTNNYQALLVGLVLYTAAFIAEVVRAGIQSVHKGQIEAATALGLTRPQQLRLVIMPQALRVIIPPLINQYLNLAKNSSLAIAVAYPDLFNVSQTIGNQSGQNVQIIFMVMGTYLLMSLTISLVLNRVNKMSQITER